MKTRASEFINWPNAAEAIAVWHELASSVGNNWNPKTGDGRLSQLHPHLKGWDESSWYQNSFCTFTREMVIALQAGRQALSHLLWFLLAVPPCWEGFWSQAQTQLELLGPWPIKDPCHDPEILYVWDHQSIGQGHPTTCFYMTHELCMGWKRAREKYSMTCGNYMKFRFQGP